jgi:hypothetical protein
MVVEGRKSSFTSEAVFSGHRKTDTDKNYAMKDFAVGPIVGLRVTSSRSGNHRRGQYAFVVPGKGFARLVNCAKSSRSIQRCSLFKKIA